MGFFTALFRRLKPGRPTTTIRYSERDIQIIGDIARRNVEIVNESLRIALDSNNPDTKLSRLGVAKQKLAETKQLAAEYPFVRLTSLTEIEIDIAAIEAQFAAAGYRALAEGNMRGESLEKEGRHDEAVAAYERLLQLGADTPFTYRRLAILYRKSKSRDNEIRILRAAVKNIPATNAAHHAWFLERLQKLQR